MSATNHSHKYHTQTSGGGGRVNPKTGMEGHSTSVPLGCTCKQGQRSNIAPPRGASEERGGGGLTPPPSSSGKFRFSNAHTQNCLGNNKHHHSKDHGSLR